jgi:hypothetical protein
MRGRGTLVGAPEKIGERQKRLNAECAENAEDAEKRKRRGWLESQRYMEERRKEEEPTLCKRRKG